MWTASAEVAHGRTRVALPEVRHEGFVPVAAGNVSRRKGRWQMCAARRSAEDEKQERKLWHAPVLCREGFTPRRLDQHHRRSERTALTTVHTRRARGSLFECSRYSCNASTRRSLPECSSASPRSNSGSRVPIHVRLPIA